MDCPNCHFQIGDDSEACPFCAFVIPGKRPAAAIAPGEPVPYEEPSPLPHGEPQRPASKAVPTAVDPVQARKQSGALLYFLAAAAVGTLVYFHLKSRPAPRPPPPIQLKTPNAFEVVEGRSSQAQPEKAGDAQKAKPAEPVDQPPIKPAPAPPEAFWEFEGQVYDMLTLKPVPGVDMTFYSEEGNQQTKSGKDGRYRMRLPALRSGGYRLAADHADYVEEYFDDAGADFRKMSLKQRASLRNSIANNLPWAARGAGSVRRDVVLFPLVPDR